MHFAVVLKLLYRSIVVWFSSAPKQDSSILPYCSPRRSIIATSRPRWNVVLKNEEEKPKLENINNRVQRNSNRAVLSVWPKCNIFFKSDTLLSWYWYRKTRLILNRFNLICTTNQVHLFWITRSFIYMTQVYIYIL